MSKQTEALKLTLEVGRMICEHCNYRCAMRGLIVCGKCFREFCEVDA